MPRRSLLAPASINHLRSARREAARRAHPRARPAPLEPGVGPLPDLHTALEALPRRYREVLVLKHAGGLTFDQIALALATNRNTIAGRYRAALKSLRGVLGAWEGGAVSGPDVGEAGGPPPAGTARLSPCRRPRRCPHLSRDAAVLAG